jgi:hypothetical protein
MKKQFSKVLIILGAALCALLFLSLIIFVFGFFMFVVLGEERYFVDYVCLDGYYPFVTLLFMLDYFCAFIGCLGIPVLTAGLIVKALD